MKGMKKKAGFVVVTGLMLMIFGCTSNPASTVFEQDTITQVSSYNGLLAGLYDGVVSYDELKPYGNFGLGTFDKMNGEMVMIDGVLYQIDFGGDVHVMDSANITPYATLVNFNEDQTIELPAGMPYDQVAKLIESKLLNPNVPYAIRIDGTFSYIKCRSVPEQEQPYPPLAEIAKNQAIFEKEQVKGSVIGFRYPQYAGAFNVPGFHIHFISDDRDFGGHVLSFTTGDDVVAKVDRCTQLMVFIPDTPDARKADLSRDRSADVLNVNRSK